VVEFVRKFVSEFTPNEKQLWEWEYYRPQECYAVERDGKTVAIGDAAYMWPGRYVLWFYAGAQIEKKDWLPMLRLFVKTLLERNDITRLEFTVDAEYPQAVRMAQLLGFKAEGYHTRYLPNGNDAITFAWVRK
jgi:RimJ/RimL family protein N-acetyltransferase